MKKLILTEEQVKSLMEKVIEEQVPAVQDDVYEISDGRYKVNCKFSFDFDDYTTYKNGEIYIFKDGVGVISYGLDIQNEEQGRGIKNIKVVDIQYPPKIPTTISYYPEGTSSEDEDWYNKRIDEQIEIPIDWRKTQTYSWDDDKQLKYIGVSDKAYVNIKPDGQGGLIGYVDEIDIRELIGNSDE